MELTQNDAVPPALADFARGRLELGITTAFLQFARRHYADSGLITTSREIDALELGILSVRDRRIYAVHLHYHDGQLTMPGALPSGKLYRPDERFPPFLMTYLAQRNYVIAPALADSDNPLGWLDVHARGTRVQLQCSFHR